MVHQKWTLGNNFLKTNKKESGKDKKVLVKCKLFKDNSSESKTAEKQNGCQTLLIMLRKKNKEKTSRKTLEI